MESLRLKNYRCFDDTREIKLKPINILLGKNNAGKSSFLKFFPLLKQSRIKHPQGVFLWYSDDVDFKDFRNTVKNGEGDIQLEFTLKKANGRRYPIRKSKKEEIVEYKVAISISSLEGNNNVDYLSHLSVSIKDIDINLNFVPSKDHLFSFEIKGDIDGKSIGIEAGTIPFLQQDRFLPQIFFKVKDGATSRLPEEKLKNGSIFYNTHLVGTGNPFLIDMFTRKSGTFDYLSKDEIKGLLLNYLNSVDKLIAEDKENFVYEYYLVHLNDIILEINSQIDKIVRNIYYIQPLRANAKRYYRYQNLSVDTIDSHGDNLPMYLNSLDKGRREELNKWIKSIFKFEFDINPSEGHIEIKIKEDNKEDNDTEFRNIVDVGFGYSQLLPIIVQIWNAVYNDKASREDIFFERDSITPPKLIVIEQPELHLHPGIMTHFAKMLVAVAESSKNKSNQDVRFIIETHSEALIEALGKIMAKIGMGGKLKIKEDDIQVLIFQKDKTTKDTSIVVTKYDENGFIEEWPYGFFAG